MNKTANKLIESNSPYLLQHAYNPVQWLPYDSKLINDPENEKLIVISIGYSACHWCHVMEHESFENDDVAKLMNENFVNIKIDREEHPHLDKLYMQACRLMTGGGGWPLNVVCTPNGIPVHAGTYFPKEQWINMLQTIQKLWIESPQHINEFKQRLGEVLLKDNEKPETEVKLPDLLEAIDKNTNLLDYNNGGLMGSPKFPMPVLLNQLVNWSVIWGNANLEQFVNLSLLKMMKGGMWDLVDGGFARYSVDENWFVPHFEKMLYDNAQLLPLYAAAAKRVKLPILGDVAEKITGFCTKELKQSNGLYAAALDADTSDGEGFYYSVQMKECKEVLNDKELDFCMTYMNFTEDGNWENGLNIPVISKPPQQILTELSFNQAELDSLQNNILKKFSQLRIGKTKPGLDFKCLCAWNGLYLNGLAEACLYDPQFLSLAEDLAEAMLQFKNGISLYHQISNGKPDIIGYLEDYAFYIQGLLALFNVTQNDTYAFQAKDLAQMALKNHLNSDGELQFQHVDQKLFGTVPDWEDNVVPSAIGSFCSALLSLSAIFGEVTLEVIAANHIKKVHSALLGHTFWHAQWLGIWTQHRAGNPVVICSNTLSYQKLMDEVKAYLPQSVQIMNAEVANVPMCEGKSGIDNSYYICHHHSCMAPVNSPEQVLEIIRDYFGYEFGVA